MKERSGMGDKLEVGELHGDSVCVGVCGDGPWRNKRESCKERGDQLNECLTD